MRYQVGAGKNLFPWFNKAFLEKISVAMLVFLLSLTLSPLYLYGDQVYYRNVYERLASLDLPNGYFYYSQSLDSLEYVHFLLSWVASRFVEKDLFIAFSNALLAYVTMALFQQWKISKIIAAWIVLTNFYFLVLYFSAERLKFGFIFMILSLMTFDKIKSFYILSCLAMVSHVQTVIIYVSMLFNVLFEQLSELFRTGQLIRLVLYFVPLLLIFFLTGDQILSKFQSYYGDHDFLNLVRTLVFFLSALWYSRRKSETIKLFLPLFVVSFLVGDDRINLFGYFFFLYYGLQYRSGWNLGVLVTSAYFSYSSIGFITKIFQHGDGFFHG